MPDDEIRQRLMALASSEQWEAGVALFNSSGVMNVQYGAKIVDARVVNERGSFERVSISFRSGLPKIKCTCRSTSSTCCHAVALLLYIAGETPELLNCLFPSDEKYDAPVNDAAGTAFTACAVSSEAIHDFLGGNGGKAFLKLQCKTELPQLKMARQRLRLNAVIVHHGCNYAQGNIKKLVENGQAAGNMQLCDFDPQSQQVMCFLAQYATFDQKELSLDSEASADLFHCLRGSGILSTPSGTVQFHLSPLQIQFNVREHRQSQIVVIPGLEVPGRGSLDGSQLSFIVGRGGYWIGRNLEFWWFPAIIPLNWLRMFIEGRQIYLSSDELSSLMSLCESKRFPGFVKVSRDVAEVTELPIGKVRPVLTLDWDANGLVGGLEMEYSGRRYEVDGEPVVWDGKDFFKRNFADENAAIELLSNAGFKCVDDRWNSVRLDDKALIWQFIHVTSPKLTNKWLVFQTPQVRINALATSDARLSVQAGKSGNDWFEATCDLKAADGTAIPFAMALEAVRNDDDFIRLPNGAVAHLPQDVFELIRTLLHRASERHDNKFNIKKFHAVALVDELEPYWTGIRPDWYMLRERLLNPSKAEIPELPDKLPSLLRDYQKEGVKWMSVLDECGFHGVLADEMGLGKTVQALAVLYMRKCNGAAVNPSMIVCPTSLLENWRAESNKFTPGLSVLIINGSERSNLFRSIQDYDVIITSYALLRRDIFEYSDLEFDYVILDEAQHIKNPRTANAQACRELKSNHRLVLTGTPMENSIGEIWSIFAFLQPGYLGTQRDFKQRYDLKKEPDKYDNALRELSSMIRPFVLRRTKNEVCAELPPKLEQDMFCEMGDEQRHLYDNLLLASRSFFEKLMDSGINWTERRMEVLAMITRLRQACCHPGLLPEEYLVDYPKDMPSVKLDLAREVILEAVDSGHRILLFSQFTSILKLFPDWLRKSHIPFECIDGSTKDRQSRVDKFNSDPSIPVFLLSLKAGGVGLNLPGADTVIHYDQWWNPMVEDQATDRSHRIGQTKTVTAIRLVTRNTIEEKILRLQDSKRELFNRIVGGVPSSLQDITAEDVAFLLR